MLHIGRAGETGFDMATPQRSHVPGAIRHSLAATASLTAIAVAAGSGEATASGLLDGLATPDEPSIRTAGAQPAIVPVGTDTTHAYFLDAPAAENAIDARIGAAFSGDRDADGRLTDPASIDGGQHALTAGQRILNAFGAAPDPLSTGPKWGPYIDFIARPGTPSSTGTIDLFVPVAQADDWLVFLNARGTLTSEPSQEAGLGGGVRHIVPDFIFGQDTILGVYGFVDFRNSSNGNSFVQGTIGAELITERFEVRINGYLPGSRTYTVAGATASAIALQGTNVVLTGTSRQEQALPGFDVEAGLRFELDPDTTFRVNGGYYRFARGGTKVEGGLARVELQFDDPFGFDGASLSVGGELRNDNYNGTHGNATLRFRLPLGASRNGGDEGAGFGDIDDLMVRPVQRFDNIVAPEVDGPVEGMGPVTDAATGQTLQVFHVAQTAQGTGDCSDVQNACTFTVAQSLAGAGDTFVAVDVAGDIALAFALNAANQRVVGAGDTGTVNVPLTDALQSVLTLGGLGGRPTVAGVDFGGNASPFVRGIATNTATGITGNGFAGTATIDDVRSTNGGLAFQNSGATINVSNSAFDGGAGIGVSLTNLTGTFSMTGSTVTSTRGGFRIEGGNGSVSHDGAVTQNGAASAIDIRNRTGGTVSFGGPVTGNTGTATAINLQNNAGSIALTGNLDIDTTTGTGIDLNGNTAPVTFGAMTQVDVAGAGTGVNFQGTTGGAVTFADLDITLAGANGTAFDLNGATVNANVTATDFDVTSTSNAGTTGIDLSGTMGAGTIQLGDTNVNGASASIAGVDVGVQFDAASNAVFVFGDGEGVTDKGSTISATTAIAGGSTVTMGSYDFDDVVFTGALDFNAGGGAGLVFVAATATGDGSGSDVNNRANVITADAIIAPNTTFVLINDGAAINDIDGFTLSNAQTMASFGNGRTFAGAGLVVPANFSGIPGGAAVITDPTGNGAATLTNTGAGDTLTALGNVTTQDFIIENTAGGDGLAGTGAIGINSTGLTIQNITGGQGIDLDNVTGTVTFNDTRVATTAGNGVDIANSTVSFTGVLDIDTAAGIGLNATGGSTLSVAATAGDQSITSTAGQALNLDTVTIGAGGVNFDTVSSTNAGNGNAGIRLNALTGAGAVSITNARVVDSGGAAGGNGIDLAGIGTAGALTIANIDIDMPTTGGNGLRGIFSTGGHTADINLGTGAGGVAIDDAALGIQLNGTAGNINIGTGAGSGGVQLTVLGSGINIGNNSTGTINIGNTATMSVFNSVNLSAINSNQSDATVTVTGIDINSAGGANGNGIWIFDNDAVGSFTLNGTNTIDNTGADGIRIQGGNATISGVTIGAAATGAADDITGNGVNVLDNGQNISVSIDNVTVADTRGAGIRVDGSGAGSVTINSFNNNTVTDADVRGIDILDATFDAVTGGAVQQVTGGNLSVGTIGDRVEGDGVRLDQVLGDIAFGTVDIFNNNGTGLFIRDAAGKGGTFAFGNTGGTINTTNGAAIDIDPVTMNSTFANLTSTNSAGRGVNLDTIAGTFTVTGTTSVTGSTTEGVRVINSTAAINLGTLNVSGTTGTAVLIENNGGGSFTATGGTVTKGGVAGDALDINGGAMAVNFGANISHTSTGGAAVSTQGGTTGNITVSGTITKTAGGSTIDISSVASGTVSFTGATVSGTTGIQIHSVAPGASVIFSAGTAIALNNLTTIGIYLSHTRGLIAFNGAVDINDAVGGGIVFDNVNTNVTFGQVDIELGAGAANADAISIGGTPGTLTFGVTTITNVGAAANQKGIDFSGTTLGGAVNFQSVAISGPDTSTSSIGVDLTGVLGNQIVNLGNQAGPAGGPSSSITDLHRGVVIDNTAAVQFTFGDGESPNDTGSSINVNGQAGAFTVDVGGGTLGASSFDFNDVAFGAGDQANLPAAAGAAVFVSQTGGTIAAGTHGLSQSVNTITVAAAEALADNDQTFVFVAHTGAGTIDVTGGGGDGFTLKDGQSLDGFDDGRVISFGTTQPANVEGNLGAAGGNVTQNSVIASNSNGAATSIVATAAGAGNSTIRNTVFDGVGLGSGDAAISVNGAANAVTINNIEITNITPSGTGIVLNNNAGGVALTDVDLTAQVAANVGRALSIDATGASTGAITVDANSDIDGTTGTVVSIGAGARNVTFNAAINAANNVDNVIDIASQSGGTIQFGAVTSANATGESVIEVTGHTAGTLTFGNVAITGFGNGGTDTAIELTGPGGSTGSVTFADLDIATANGAGLTASGAGLSVSATSGDFNITGGPAVDLSGVRALNFALTSITANGGGTVADGIVLDNLAANSTFSVTGTTTIDNYSDAGIQISSLGSNTQDINFGATNINRNSAVATGRGIIIDSIGGTGVDIDFGTTQVGQGTVTTLGVLVKDVGAGATGFDTDFASLNINRAQTGFEVDNVDIAGAAVGVTGTTTIANAATDGISIINSAGNVTFTGATNVTNNTGFNGDGVDLGTSAGGANAGIYTFNGLDVTVNGAGAFGLRATNTGTLDIVGGTNQITSNNGTAVFINPTVTDITLQNVTSNNATGSGVDLTLTGNSNFVVTGTTSVTGSDEAGVEITGGGVNVSLGTLNIDNDGAAADGAGLVVDNASADTLNLNVTAGTIASGNDSAIDIRNTGTGTVNLGVALTNVSVNGAAVGINILRTNGTMTGSLNTGTGGSIAGTTTRAIDVEGGTETVLVGQSVTTATGEAVRIANKTGGSFTHSGNINHTGTGQGIVVNNTSGGAITTFSGTSKAINSGTSTAVSLSGNAGATINLINGGLDIDTTTGIGFSASGGTVIVSGANNTIQTTSGRVLRANGNIQLNATFASAGASALNGNIGIDLQQVSGNLAIQGGSITNTGNAQAIRVGSSGNGVGGNAAINIATNVNSSGATGLAADIRELTGGSVTLSGNFTDDNAVGGGLAVRNIDNGAGATVTLSGTTKQFNTGTNFGVQLNTNTNGTINFTNGGLAVTSTTQSAFTAANGGTVTVQGTGNSVTSTTGNGVAFFSTTIGGAGVTFQSVSSNGASNGIVLNNTGAGGFTVTGTGTTDGSGGTITGGTDNVSLTDAASVSLSNMNLQNATATAIRATRVNGLTLDNVLIDNAGSHGLFGISITALTLTDSQIEDNGNAANEHGVFITNLLGTSNIERNTFVRNSEVQMRIVNTSATAAAPGASQDIINILRNSFAQHTGPFFGDNLQIEAGAGSNMVVNIGDGTAPNANTFDTGQDGAHIIAATGGTMDATINRNTRTNGTGQGFNLQASANSTLTFDVNNNTITDTGSSGVNAVHVGTNDLTTTTGRIRNNTITRVGQINPGGSAFYIRAVVEGSGNHTVLIDNNTASGNTGFNNLNGNSGIFVRAGDPSDNGNLRMDATITGNNVSDAGFRSIEAVAGTSTGGTGEVLCVNIAGNTAANGANGDDAIRVEQRNNTTFHIQGFAGTGTNEADIVNHLNTQNPASGTVDVRNAGGTVVINYTAATCNTP